MATVPKIYFSFLSHSQYLGVGLIERLSVVVTLALGQHFNMYTVLSL